MAWDSFWCTIGTGIWHVSPVRKFQIETCHVSSLRPQTCLPRALQDRASANMSIILHGTDKLNKKYLHSKHTRPLVWPAFAMPQFIEKQSFPRSESTTDWPSDRSGLLIRFTGQTIGKLPARFIKVYQSSYR